MTSTMPTDDRSAVDTLVRPAVPTARPAPEAGALASVTPETVRSVPAGVLPGALGGEDVPGRLDRVAVDLEASARAARWVLRLLLLGLAGLAVVALA